MIPNNIYYRRIAQLLNNTEYEHFYSSLYYMKRIAQSFGETYTGFNPSNKYLKDWAIARGVTDDGEHHINRYWLHKIALTYDNSTLAGKTDNYYLKIIYENLTIGERTGTILSLTTPVITVTDEFDVSGHLEDEDGNNLTGLTVKLLCDNVQVATDTTDEDGNVKFHRSAVTTRTNYTFQLVFSGNTNYAGSTSSIETVMPDKETTVFDISSPINNTTYYTDSDVLVSGRLIDNDGQAVANKTIYIYDQWNTKDWGTATTDSNGYFSKSLDYDPLFDGISSTQLTTSLHIFFQGDNEFTRVDQYIDGIVAKPYINLESDKSILSKADDDEAVLTATLYSSDKVGKAVSFDIVDSQGTVLSHIGDGVTNSNGIAVSDHNYESGGVGDIIIRASATVEGILVSKTYSIRDLSYYDASSSEHLSKYTIPSNKSMTYDSTNTCYTCSQSDNSGTNTVLLNNATFSNHCRIKADILIGSTNNSQPRIGLWNGNNGITCRTIISGTSTYFGLSSQTKGNDGSNIDLKQNIGISVNNWYTVIVEYNNGSVSATLKQGDTVISSVSGAETTLGATNSFGIDIGFVSTSQFKIKNIEIQEL